MGLYIKGLKMPKRMPIKAIIFPDGKVTVTLHSGKALTCSAVPAPKHGRLIDADALMHHLEYLLSYCTPGSHCALRVHEMMVEVGTAPTIIPAEEGET